MKGWTGLMGGGKSLPPPPKEEIRSNSLGRPDGRSARATASIPSFGSTAMTAPVPNAFRSAT